MRARKRAKLASEELVATTAKEVETSHVTSKSDDQLFVLDTTAEHVPGGAAAAKATSKQKKKGLSDHEQAKVQALLKQHDAKSLKKLVHDNKPEVQRAKRIKKTVGNVQAKFDLWGSDTASSSKAVKAKPTVAPSPGIGDALAGTAPAHVYTKQRAAKKLTKKTIAVEVAHGGQSYHPDKEQHQDMVGEALALELRRKEVKDYVTKPISAGMSESTKAVLLGSDDEESDEDEQESDAEMEIKITKKREKMTTAQRNKQKRHRALEKEIQERKKAKKLLNSVVELKRYNKQLTKKQQEDAERKKTVQKLKEQSERTLGHNVFQNVSQRDPLGAPTLPVALSSELRSSLRSMKPKGSLLEDRFESFRDRSMADKKHVGDRKHVVQGKRRRIKVKGNSQYSEGSDFHLMG